MSLSPRSRLTCVLIWFAALVAVPARAQNSQPSSHPATVRYILSLANRPEHLVEVKMLLGPGASERDLQLPAWNALYQVRDFSQYVNWVRATTGDVQSLPLRHPDKLPWHLSGAAHAAEPDYDS